MACTQRTHNTRLSSPLSLFHFCFYFLPTFPLPPHGTRIHFFNMATQVNLFQAIANTVMPQKAHETPVDDDEPVTNQ